MMEDYEECVECWELTGKAGRKDDSIYVYDTDNDMEVGPICEECYDEGIREGWFVEL